MKGIFMSYEWTTEWNGYRSVIKTDFPAGTWVYTSENSMVRFSGVPPLKSEPVMTGDVSSCNVIVVGKNEKYLLAGAVTAFRSQTILRALYEQRRITGIEVWQPEIREGETPEEMVILEGCDWRELLCRYADIAAEKMGVRPIDSRKNVTGYCSWYYYYKDVSEQNMLENVDALIANRTPYTVEYIQIDDGFQTFQGDWLDQHDSWPTPLSEIAKKITSAGIRAGIWTMPTTASTGSRIYQEHPEWFVKKENGDTAVLPGWSPAPDNLWACLDATIPEVREHIANVFKTFRSWGFTYFKMDGLYFGLQKGIRRDPSATTVSAFRLLLETIRKAVPDSVLMACSEPFMPCLGLVDNARMSNDTSRYFKKDGAVCRCDCSITDAFNISLSNFWMFDRWFRCDPDVVMARQNNAFYSRNEAKFSVLAAIMTGVAFTSDHLGLINPDRNVLLARAQDVRMRNVRPFNCAANAWADTFEGEINGKRAVAVVNFSDSISVRSLESLQMPQACIDLIDDKKVIYEINLAPHDAVLLVSAD